MATAGELLEQWVTTFNQSQWDAGVALFAPDAVEEEIGTGRTMSVQEGLQSSKDWKAAFPNAAGTITNRIASGNQAAAEIVWRGTNTGPLMGNPPTGKRVEIRAVAVIEEKGGKIARIRHYIDMAAMMQQLGMMPAAGAGAR